MRFPHLLAAAFLAWLFTSCATRPAAQPVQETRPRNPTARPAITPIALKPSVEEPETLAAPLPMEPTRAEKIIRLVQNGGLIQADRSTLVFSKFRTMPATPSGLYEDAITLGRLRRQLKHVRGLPADIPGSATVREARVYLILEDGVGIVPAAGAIDAALKTQGVTAVHARIFTPAIRL